MCRVDVTNREKVLETGKKVQNEVGIISILVNNAGIMPQHQLLKHTEKEIRSIFEINVLAHFWILEARINSNNFFKKFKERYILGIFAENDRNGSRSCRGCFINGRIDGIEKFGRF